MERSVDRRGWLEAGRSGLEYVGITVVAALVAGFVVYFTPTPITRSFNHAVCVILQFGNCGIADAGPVVHEKTPFERAVAGSFYLFGDSFASGEGAGQYEEGTDWGGFKLFDPDTWDVTKIGKPKNVCHRSAESYQAKLIKELMHGGAFRGQVYSSHACSGARVVDIYSKNENQDNEPPQAYFAPPSDPERFPFDKIPGDVSLIGFSMGGNDVGFGEILKSCLTRRLAASGCGDTAAIRVKIDAVYGTNQMQGALEKQVAKMKAERPKARIIIMGYPPLFAERPPVKTVQFGPFSGPVPDFNGSLMGVEDQKWANDRATDMNKSMAAMAERQGVEFIDPTIAFVGNGYDHRIGSGAPWINGLIFDMGSFPVASESFHPNMMGQQALYGIFKQKVKEG